MSGKDTIDIKVVPRSSRNSIEYQPDGKIKIHLNSPPVDGKANAECIGILSKKLGVAKSSIHIVRGEKSRNKKVIIEGMKPADVVRIIIGDS